MELLKEYILKQGIVLNEEVVKVDSFLNHQIDVQLLDEIGKEFHRRFLNENVTKILTIEASGIGIAVMAARYFKVPVVFAKKTESKNLDKEIYQSEVYSFTKQRRYPIMVSKRYINAEDRVLIIDDFLANGEAALALKDIVEKAEAKLVGGGIVIEKGFQKGGKILRDKGIKLESLAIIESIEDGIIKFK